MEVCALFITRPSVLTMCDQFLKEREHDNAEIGEGIAREQGRRPSHSRTRSTPAIRRRSEGQDERAPLLQRRRSFDQADADAVALQADPIAGGTILGIHNLAIVFPQFIVRGHIRVRAVQWTDAGTDCPRV